MPGRVLGPPPFALKIASWRVGIWTPPNTRVPRIFKEQVESSGHQGFRPGPCRLVSGILSLPVKNSGSAPPLGLQRCVMFESSVLVHGQVTIIFAVSVVCLSLFVCLFVQSFFSAVFDPIWIKLGHMLHVRV